MLKTITLIAATATLPMAANSATIGGFSDLLVFGDSLSDPFVADLPTDIYPNSQFTNGDTWAVQLGATQASGRNFAVAGATAFSNGDETDDFAEQITSFANSGLALGDSPLAAVWFGGNDVGDAVMSATPAEQLGFALEALAGGILALQTLGINNFLVFGVPDVGATPLLQDIDTSIPGAAAGATFLTDQFNAQLNGILSSLPGGDQIAYVDIPALLADVTASPADFGFSNVTDACFVPEESFCGTAADGFLYYDPFHPTEQAHTLVADLATQTAATLAPIPLPASAPLVLLGLAGLGALRHRKCVATVA